MKLKSVVLALVLAMAVFAGWETLQGRNPVDRVMALLDKAPSAVPAPAAATRDVLLDDQTVLILSAPPRDSVEAGHKRFDPVAVAAAMGLA